MLPVDGGYADTAAPRSLLVGDVYCAPANCCKEDTGADVLRGYEALGIRRRDTSTQALVATSRCQKRGIGRGETGTMSRSRHDR
jgi:hypothetical protein